MNPKEKNPFPYTLANKRYHTWDYYLKTKFGGKVFKVSLDGGFSCPNIDGTKGTGGCTYCSYSFRRQTPDDLLAQCWQGVDLLHKKWPDATQYIPSF
ncbi:MAG: TIGR01212 family radical SAM protein, partial [Oscillospiraceae bacterium]